MGAVLVRRFARLSFLLRLSFLVMVVAGCGEGGDGTTGVTTEAGSSGTGEGSSGGSAGATGGSGGTGDAMCPDRPAGSWNACKKGGLVDNKLCGGDGGAAITCLSPSSGSFNVCGLEACADDCDCFAPPASGDAVVFCAPLLGGGGKACALYCAGGQTCPDGMQCQGGYCYWPD